MENVITVSFKSVTSINTPWLKEQAADRKEKKKEQNSSESKIVSKP